MVIKIITQTSVSISFQNALLARERDISPKCPQKITGKLSVPNKPKQADAKVNKGFKKKKSNSRIKFVGTQ